MKVSRICIIIAVIAGLITITARWTAEPFMNAANIISGFIASPVLEEAENPVDTDTEHQASEDEPETEPEDEPEAETEIEIETEVSGVEEYPQPEEATPGGVEPPEEESIIDVKPGNMPGNAQESEPEFSSSAESNPEEKAIEITPAAQPGAFAMTVLDDTSVIVTNLAELTQALSVNNGYVNIYLGADIDLTSGITIHTSKKSVVIDGVNPHDSGGTVHTVNDYATNGVLGTVGIRSDSGTKSLTIRNMNIVGRNFYSTFAVELAALQVDMQYENVSYIGPQITHNRGGTVKYRDCSIIIDNTPDSNPRQEVAECLAVEFEGKVDITHRSTINSTFWFTGTGGYIKLLPDAEVTIYSESKELFFADLGAVDIIIEEGASLNANTQYGLAYYVATHSAGKISLAENAGFYLTKRALYLTEPAVRVRGSITAAASSRFHVFAPFTSTYPLIQFTTSDTGAEFTDPDSVILYNGGNAPPFQWTTGTGYIRLLAQDVSYWRSAAALSVAGSLDDPPLYRWQKPTGELLSINATLNTATAITALNTNYTEQDGTVAPSAGTFSMQSARVLAFGRLPLALGKLMEGHQEVVGTTKPDAAVRIRYPTGEGERILNSTAKESGIFHIGIPDFLTAGTIVNATANKDFLTRDDSTQVYASDGKLHFLQLPESLGFMTTRLTPEISIIPREDTDFAIIVGDTRTEGSDWRLTVSVLSPMKALHGHTLHDALIFIDENGLLKTLDGTSTLIAQGAANEAKETVISWPQDKGLLLRVNPERVLSEHSYEGLLSWVLTDAP